MFLFPFSVSLFRVHIGYFSTKEEASRVYNNKAKELFGDFAFINSV